MRSGLGAARGRSVPAFGCTMRILFSIAALTVATAVQSYAWIHPIPDYKKQFEDADVVAIVRVSGVTNTGSTKRLKTNSRLEFRECELQMQIVSLFKGETTNSLKCRLYRFPTKKEREADLGERDAAVEYMKANP